MSIGKVFGIALLTFALGCAKKTPEVATPEPEPVAAPAPAPAPAPEPVEAMFGPVVAAVLFETGGMGIEADQMGAVDAAAAVLKDSTWSVAVVGLADATGDAAVNKELSQKRADVVAAELLTRSGVPADRVKAVGIGEKLATGQSQSERKVEFVFHKKTDRPLKQIVMKSGVLEEDFRAKRAVADEPAPAPAPMAAPAPAPAPTYGK